MLSLGIRSPRLPDYDSSSRLHPPQQFNECLTQQILHVRFAECTCTTEHALDTQNPHNVGFPGNPLCYCKRSEYFPVAKSNQASMQFDTRTPGERDDRFRPIESIRSTLVIAHKDVQGESGFTYLPNIFNQWQIDEFTDPRLNAVISISAFPTHLEKSLEITSRYHRNVPEIDFRRR